MGQTVQRGVIYTTLFDIQSNIFIPGSTPCSSRPRNEHHVHLHSAFQISNLYLSSKSFTFKLSPLFIFYLLCLVALFLDELSFLISSGFTSSHRAVGGVGRVLADGHVRQIKGRDNRKVVGVFFFFLDTSVEVSDSLIESGSIGRM